MREPAWRARLDVELFARNLARAENVPKPVFAPQAAIACIGDAADHQGLRVEHPPVLEARWRVDIRRAVDEGGGRDRFEQAGTFEVRRDDLRGFTGEVGAREFGDGDGDRAHLPAPDFNLDLRPRQVRRKHCEGNQQSTE